MSYAESPAPHWSVLHTLRRSFKLTGRSNRSELIYYWLGTSLVISLLTLPFLIAGAARAGLLAGGLTYAALLIPLPALLVRRFHDIGLFGYWVLAIFGGAVLSKGMRSAGWLQGDWSWVATMVNLGVFLLIAACLAWPGQQGENCYDVEPG